MNQVKIIGIDYGVNERKHPDMKFESVEERIVDDILTSVAQTYDTECPEYCFHDNDIICISSMVLFQEDILYLKRIQEILKTKTKKDIIIQRWGFEQGKPFLSLRMDGTYKNILVLP